MGLYFSVGWQTLVQKESKTCLNVYRFPPEQFRVVPNAEQRNECSLFQKVVLFKRKIWEIMPQKTGVNPFFVQQTETDS